MRRWWWLYALLLALAFGAGLASDTAAPDSPIPSIDNPGPKGLKLLRRWLEQTGRDVRVVRGELPEDLRTLVVAAPLGHAAPSEPIERFVKAGGTLVYLAPRRTKVQRNLDEWLHLGRANGPARDPSKPDDLLGVTERVTVNGGALTDVHTLRVLADEALTVDLPDAVPVTKSKMLWWWPLEKGEVFIGSGPDLAEGSRLELEDNAAFWAALPSPIGFDEVHQSPKPTPNLSANLIAALLQLAFCGLAFVLCFGPRLGPPRPTPQVTHRSSLEYVASMGALAASANVEAELAAELCKRLQRELELTDAEMPMKPREVKTPRDFLRLSQQCAKLEKDT